MKSKIYLWLLSALFLVSCKKILEPVVDGTYPDEVTWSLPDKAEGVLINAYSNIPNTFDNYAGNNFLDAASDNAVSNNYNSAIYRVGSAGSLSALDNPIGNWGTAYYQIRNVNLFLENGLTSNVIYDLTSRSNDSLFKKRLKGEAYFLRAWWSFQLLQQFGGKANNGEALGYPILIRTLTDAEARNLDIERNTYEECAVQIMRDCDTAFSLLPFEYRGSDNITGVSGLGRADQKAAQALKARTAIYAASPAYQSNNIIKLNNMGNYDILNTSEYQRKWKRAVEISNTAVDIIGNFSSFRLADFSKATTPADFIWRRYHNARFMEVNHYPPYEFGNAITGPSQNLVDAFPALNGYPITDARSGYNAANPYANRDPRLSLNVYYNTAIFNGRQLEIFDGGLDSRAVFRDATRTGYYLKKWLSVKQDILNPQNLLNDYHYHAMLRKTELHLNLAEAMNEMYGPSGTSPENTRSASAILKSIRRGAGLIGGTSDAYVDEIAAKGKDEFRKLIQNERRLELAFENHRYFDMRRWLLSLNESIKGMQIVKNGTEYSYTIVEVEKRPLNNLSYYYLPLPYEETSKSKALINNLGW